MIVLKNVGKTYNPKSENKFTALDNINLTIKDGELVAIIGSSGAGKSTLLHLVAGIDTVSSGEIIVDNTPINSLNAKKLAVFRNSISSIILQDFALLDDFTVFDNVLLPLQFSKSNTRGRKQKVKSILEALHISDLSKKYIHQLSGGQKQRVAIARALVTSPRYIFADEPTGSLDSKTSEDILNILLELNKRDNITVVIVTHDISVANKCNRIITINDGQIIEDTHSV